MTLKFQALQGAPYICGVSKIFGEWYQKKKTEDTNKLTLLGFKIIIILHNTRLATFIKLLETGSKGLFRNRSQNSCRTFLDYRRTVAIQERFVCFLVLFTENIRHTTYMELLVKPEI
jgi:hypothetical protein